MNETLNEITRRWWLTARDRKRFAHASHGTVNGLSVAKQCLDIDRALLWLPGDRASLRRWLRTPHPAFYHLPPLQLVLGYPLGRQTMRAALLGEAAEANDPLALAVLGVGGR